MKLPDRPFDEGSKRRGQNNNVYAGHKFFDYYRFR